MISEETLTFDEISEKILQVLQEVHTHQILYQGRRGEAWVVDRLESLLKEKPLNFSDVYGTASKYIGFKHGFKIMRFFYEHDFSHYEDLPEKVVNLSNKAHFIASIPELAVQANLEELKELLNYSPKRFSIDANVKAGILGRLIVKIGCEEKVKFLCNMIKCEGQQIFEAEYDAYDLMKRVYEGGFYWHKKTTLLGELFSGVQSDAKIREFFLLIQNFPTEMVSKGFDMLKEEKKVSFFLSLFGVVIAYQVPEAQKGCLDFFDKSTWGKKFLANLFNIEKAKEVFVWFEKINKSPARHQEFFCFETDTHNEPNPEIKTLKTLLSRFVLEESEEVQTIKVDSKFNKYSLDSFVGDYNGNTAVHNAIILFGLMSFFGWFCRDKKISKDMESIISFLKRHHILESKYREFYSEFQTWLVFLKNLESHTKQMLYKFAHVLEPREVGKDVRMYEMESLLSKVPNRIEQDRDQKKIKIIKHS